MGFELALRSSFACGSSPPLAPGPGRARRENLDALLPGFAGSKGEIHLNLGM